MKLHEWMNRNTERRKIYWRQIQEKVAKRQNREEITEK
jgi:hypothetical protein